MPNWCSTTITISHEDENKLVDLYNKIEKWCETDYKENGFNKYWLGNIVGNSGIGTIDEGSDTDLRCRGYISDMDVACNQLIIYTETAWVPMLRMWVRLLDKYLPDAELTYIAEECGCGLFCTDDSCMVGNYIIDPYDLDDMEHSYSITEKEAVKELQKLLQTSEGDIKRLLKMLEDSEYCDALGVHQWEYVNVYDFD